MSTIRPTDIESTPPDPVAPLSSRPAQARREPLRESPAQAASDRVTLSSEAAATRTAAAGLQAPIDMKKVEEMQKAVAEGRAPFDPKRVAAALLEETLARLPVKAADR